MRTRCVRVVSSNYMGHDVTLQAKKAAPDWERIEADYRAGLLSVREIAAAHQISHTAIQKRAKANSWERDLAARIQAKADLLVAKSEVASQVASPEKVATDTAIVDANAKVIADVRVTHRKYITRFRVLALALLEELEVETGDVSIFHELGEYLRSEDEKGVDKRNDIYMKVISGAGRIDGAKKLAETLKILIGLEREAYGMVDVQGKDEKADNLAVALEAARKRRRDVG
jgi:hypothetical protein